MSNISTLIGIYRVICEMLLPGGHDETN